MAKKSAGSKRTVRVEDQPVMTIPDEQHPEYVDLMVGEEPNGNSSSYQNDYLQSNGDSEVDELEMEEGTLPLNIPTPIPQPIPRPIVFCSPCSGRYTYDQIPRPNVPIEPPILDQTQEVLFGLTMTVRVDADRFFPQKKISVEASRIFPRVRAHVIADIVSDSCVGINKRVIRANITYRDGDTATLLPWNQIKFEASRGRGIAYGNYQITFSGGSLPAKTFKLKFQSRFIDPVEFEVDRVSNAGTIVTSYNTGSHPNRPGTMPIETLSLATVFQRAGFDAKMSPNSSVIPIGSTGTWSDTEMHNAMVTYWSRFANKPQWALWVLYAARHDQGRGLGGIMFDDIGPNHRQGTAIFTDSFIQDVPNGDPNPAAWRQRMMFWTAVHEMGHAFNLAHSWQKALGAPYGNPWIPLINRPEDRSFMNYPYSVSGGERRFFSDFPFRFSNEELVFMRHAPRRFVQMGNSDWFQNHGFEAPSNLLQIGTWELSIRPNRELNVYSFLEPVAMELKLTNTSGTSEKVDEHLLADGNHFMLLVGKEGGTTKQWRPMITSCHKAHDTLLNPGESIYGNHTISYSTNGWVIDEPGFYKVQAAVTIGNDVIVSNVLRLQVAPPQSTEETKIATDYFTEEVGRALRFKGAPILTKAMDTLAEVIRKCPNNPAAIHAGLALSVPLMREFKQIDFSGSKEDAKVVTSKKDPGTVAKIQNEVLLKSPDKAADTLGHIPFFEALDELSSCMNEAGKKAEAKTVLEKSVSNMKKRKVLQTVIQKEERKLNSLKS